MPTEIGSSYVKMHFAEILRRADQGESFTITLRGEATADIIPTRVPARRSEAEVAKAVEALRKFPRFPAVPHETIREWIEEGRE